VCVKTHPKMDFNIESSIIFLECPKKDFSS
jgi:hypothetical protein